MKEDWFVSWLEEKQGKTYQYKMEKFRYALDILDHPEQAVPVIHVAGTNGKGSTIAFLSQLLQAHGLKVGTFTSPHMISVHDRICIQERPIGERDFEELARQVYELEQEVQTVYEPFSYFETMTLLMFLYFEARRPDVALVEVGIGGLHDVTNVVSPVLSIITSIGLDHQDLLGETLVEIAAQKAGIIKLGIPVISGVSEEVVQTVLTAIARDKRAPLYQLGSDFSLLQGKFQSSLGQFSGLKLGLLGSHQADNAAVALQACLLYLEQLGQSVEVALVFQALSQTSWAGRLELVQSEPAIYLDGAHNVPAMMRLVDFIQEQGQGGVTLLFSAIQRKDFQQMLAYVNQSLPGVKLVLTSFCHEESLQAQQAGSFSYELDYHVFIEEWNKTAAVSDSLYITGSLYFISEVRQYLLQKENGSTNK